MKAGTRLPDGLRRGILAAWLLLAGAGAAADLIVAEGWADLAGHTEQEARSLAEQRAYEDLRDRIEGAFFFWSPATGARLMSPGKIKLAGNAAPYGAKVTSAEATALGMYCVKVATEATSGRHAAPAAAAKAVSVTKTAPLARGPAQAFAAARRDALQEAIGQAMALHFAVHRAQPGMTPGRAFPVGPYSIGLGRDELMLAMSIKVTAGGSADGAPRSTRNVLIEVAHSGGADTFRQNVGTRSRYKGGKADLRYGAGRMGRGGLNTTLGNGKLKARVHASQQRSVSSGSGAMTLMVQDGTTGYLDMGAWAPMSVPYQMGGIDPRTGRPVQLSGTMPIMTHTGARLAVRATILDGDRVRITAMPEYASLTRGGTGRKVAGTAATVTTRDGQPAPLGGLTWRGAGNSARTSRTLNLVVTPHIR